MTKGAENSEWETPNTGVKWSPEHHAELKKLWEAGEPFKDIARKLGRTALAIAIRVQGMENLEGSGHVNSSDLSTWRNLNSKKVPVKVVPPKIFLSVDNLRRQVTYVLDELVDLEAASKEIKPKIRYFAEAAGSGKGVNYGDLRGSVLSSISHLKFTTSGNDYFLYSVFNTLLVEEFCYFYDDLYELQDTLRNCMSLNHRADLLKFLDLTENDMNPITQNTAGTMADFAQPAVVTKTFVFGADVASLTDDQLISRIGQIEGEIKNLDSIENKPKKLVAKIKAMKDNIKAIVEIIDGR